MNQTAIIFEGRLPISGLTENPITQKIRHPHQTQCDRRRADNKIYGSRHNPYNPYGTYNLYGAILP